MRHAGLTTFSPRQGQTSGMTQYFQEALPFFTPTAANEAEGATLSGRLPSYIKDHHARLRDRFVTGGAAAPPDYEMLELILFRAIPRQDVKPLARALIDQFGNFDCAISTPIHKLKQVKGIGDAVVVEIKIVEAAAHRMARSRIMALHVVSSWDALLDYCHTVMAHRYTEQFRILYLDTKSSMIADEKQARGTIDHVPVYPREVVKRGLELNAASMILVHNHQSDDPTPLQADITITAQITATAQALGITRCTTI